MSFQSACLIVNPASGRAGALRARLPALLRLLEAQGTTAELLETTPDPGSASQLAAHAAGRCELVIACGGDGTVHGVLQGVAGTAAILGVLPFGTANALARNLGLALDPESALRQLLTFTAARLPLGRARIANQTRWFTVMAGAGPDGALVRQMNLSSKSTAGRRAYYTAAARLFCTQRFAPFQVEYRLPGSPDWHTRTVAALMAARIPDLGGLFRGLTPAARLHHPHLSVQLISAPAHLGLGAWFSFGKSGLSHRNPWLATVEAAELRCLPLQGAQVHAQVDGEAAGALPMHLEAVAQAVSLLVPLSSRACSPQDHTPAHPRR